MHRVDPVPKNSNFGTAENFRTQRRIRTAGVFVVIDLIQIVMVGFLGLLAYEYFKGRGNDKISSKRNKQSKTAKAKNAPVRSG